MGSPVADARGELAGRLRSARTQIEEEALDRIRAIVGPAADADPECAARLRPALGGTLEYIATAIEQSESPVPSPPPVFAEEIRRAARDGLDLATMLRCCIALHAALVDFLLAELVDGRLSSERLGPLLHALYLPVDSLLAEVGRACSAEGAHA